MKANIRRRKINSHTTQGNINRSIWQLALPMTSGAILFNLFSLVDLFFVGRLGHVAVAALSIAGMLLSVVIMFTMGIATGTTALVAHFMGSRDYDAADNTVFQTIILSTASWLVMSLLGVFACDNLLRLFGASEEIIPAAAAYLRISFIFSIFIFLFVGLNQALRGAGDIIMPLKVVILANLLNIALDPLFIFGWGVFPRLEVAGSAIATVISRAMGTLIVLIYMLRGYSALHLNRRACRINLPIITRMAKIGFYASIQVFLREISLLFLLRLVSSFGVTALAAFGICVRLRMVAIIPAIGMANTAAVLVGQNMGADQPKRAMHAGWRTVWLYQAFIIPIAVIFILFAPNLIKIFNSHIDVVRIGAVYLRFSAVVFPFVAFSVILGRGINGAGDTLAPAVITGISQLGFRISVSYLLALNFGLGLVGIWLGIIGSDILQGGLIVYYFYKGYWKNSYYRYRANLAAYPLSNSAE
ncbi:MAG: MATE family efflux transporter [Candidatus Omnitrophica bacterium]|nr:MATE family efflux transporter [Candidatus Omnitrophota bacterium]